MANYPQFLFSNFRRQISFPKISEAPQKIDTIQWESIDVPPLILEKWVVVPHSGSKLAVLTTDDLVLCWERDFSSEGTNYSKGVNIIGGEGNTLYAHWAGKIFHIDIPSNNILQAYEALPFTSKTAFCENDQIFQVDISIYPDRKIAFSSLLDGKVNWEQTGSANYTASSGDYIILRNLSMISCIELNSMEEIWQMDYKGLDVVKENSGKIRGSDLAAKNLIIYENTIFEILANQLILAIDLASGKINWQKRFGDEKGYGGMGLGPDELLHFVSVNHYAKIDLDSGEIVQDSDLGTTLFDQGANVIAAPLTFSEKHAYFSAGKIFGAFEIESMEKCWLEKLKTSLKGDGFPIPANGKLWMVDMEGNLIVME